MVEIEGQELGFELKRLDLAPGVRKQGRVVYYRLAAGFPEPLRNHCFRQLVQITRASQDGHDD